MIKLNAIEKKAYRVCLRFLLQLILIYWVGVCMIVFFVFLTGLIVFDIIQNIIEAIANRFTMHGCSCRASIIPVRYKPGFRPETSWE